MCPQRRRPEASEGRVASEDTPVRVGVPLRVHLQGEVDGSSQGVVGGQTQVLGLRGRHVVEGRIRGQDTVEEGPRRPVPVRPGPRLPSPPRVTLRHPVPPPRPYRPRVKPEDEVTHPQPPTVPVEYRPRRPSWAPGVRPV